MPADDGFPGPDDTAPSAYDVDVWTDTTAASRLEPEPLEPADDPLLLERERERGQECQPTAS
jgi:hypothetical protein